MALQYLLNVEIFLRQFFILCLIITKIHQKSSFLRPGIN